MRSLAGNGAHFCGTAVDLSIYCWGFAAYVDTTGAAISTGGPTRLQSNIAWLQVSPGGQHNCAVANDHSAYCWGDNSSGQLGDNGTTRRFAPQRVFGGFKFHAVASGGAHSCGILEALDGTALCWGSNVERPARRRNVDQPSFADAVRRWHPLEDVSVPGGTSRADSPRTEPRIAGVLERGERLQAAIRVRRPSSR